MKGTDICRLGKKRRGEKRNLPHVQVTGRRGKKRGPDQIERGKKKKVEQMPAATGKG